MKGRILCGSLLTIFLLILVPVTNAIQIQTVEKDISASFCSYDMMKNMDSASLIAFIRTLAKDYPELYYEFQQKVKEIEGTSVSSRLTEQLGVISHHSTQGPQPTSDNQTMLEKIYWKIFNYRVFRLFLSTALFLYFHSKLTLMRTMTWGIKLLRWVKIGILLGFVDPSQQPQTPNIACTTDSTTNRITIATADANINWRDIVITLDKQGATYQVFYANGTAIAPVNNTAASGVAQVTAGDYIQLSTYTGNVRVTLMYVPTNSLLGSWTINV